MLSAEKTKENKTRKIISSKIFFKDRFNRHIVGYVDSVRGKTKNKPIVVIIPGYAETKRDYISTAFYLAHNGFVVIRFDCANQLGESDGEILEFKPSDVESGIKAVFDYVERTFKVTQVGLIASSLSGRIAFKVAVNEERIKYIIALTSIVDLRKTLFTLYKEDLVDEYKKGVRWGVLDILGFEVKDDFLKEAIDNKYDDLKSTLKDIRSLKIPVLFIAAGDDAWVNPNDIELSFNAARHPKSKIIKIQSALHQIQENPRLAQRVIIQMVSMCSMFSDSKKDLKETVKVPQIHDIVSQNKVELKDLRAFFSLTKNGEKEFWADYLSKFFVVMKSKDYQDLLSLVLQLLGEVRSGDKILDAGCGNGHFGAWLLCHLKDKIKSNNYSLSVEYTGLDFAEKAIDDAKEMHKNLMAEIDPRGSLITRYKLEYRIADLEKSLAFPNNTFNKICCNLVLSYLTNFEKALKGMFSVLVPGGKIVITSLKPYSDLSLIYKNYLDQDIDMQEILEGRKLLSSAGKIRHKEKKGYYHFFEEKELEQILKSTGFKKIKTYRSFGNQANVAVAEKNN